MWKPLFFVTCSLIQHICCQSEEDLGQKCINQTNYCFRPYTCDTTDNICRCPEGTTEFSKDDCVGLVGKNCSTYRRPCVSNASCDEESNICKCDEGYVPSEDWKSCRKKIYGETCQKGECGSNFECLNGTCQCGTGNPILLQDSSGCRKKVNGEACQKKEDCIHETLDCLNGTCTCPSGKAYVEKGYELSYGRRGYPEHYKVPDNICVSKVGGSCYFWPSKDRKPCVRNTHCNVYEICECADGFHAGEDGFYYAKHETDCHNAECREGLHCYEGKCACPNQEYEVYDQEICKRVPGASCIASHNHCIKDAFCNADGKCECHKGYVQLDSFKCGRKSGFGEACDYKESISAETKCDERQGLACIQHVCRCRNKEDSYDTQTHQCARPEGFPCRKEGECIKGNQCDFSRMDPAGVCRKIMT